MQFAEAAENTTRKDRRINIRLSDHDLAGIQRKAAEQGIPYQSLIAGLIHQFVEGPLVQHIQPGQEPTVGFDRLVEIMMEGDLGQA